MSTVITYQAPDGQTINLTLSQAEALRRSGTWPRNHLGQEFSVVAQCLHRGVPTYSHGELRTLHRGV